MEAEGGAVIVIDVLATTVQVPSTVYVIVYVPAVLLPGSISPVTGSRSIPAVEVKVPPAAPLMTGTTGASVLQKGEPVYDIVVAVAALSVTDVVALTTVHPLAAAIV